MKADVKIKYYINAEIYIMISSKNKQHCKCQNTCKKRGMYDNKK